MTILKPCLNPPTRLAATTHRRNTVAIVIVPPAKRPFKVQPNLNSEQKGCRHKYLVQSAARRSENAKNNAFGDIGLIFWALEHFLPFLCSFPTLPFFPNREQQKTDPKLMLGKTHIQI